MGKGGSKLKPEMIDDLRANTEFSDQVSVPIQDRVLTVADLVSLRCRKSRNGIRDS